MRLFVALDLDETVRANLKSYSAAIRDAAPDARWVGEASFHVTLKFIGSCDSANLGSINQALSLVHMPPIEVHVRDVGFFPSRGAARVFWAGVEARQELVRLAWDVDEQLAKLGIGREHADYHPHITLARSGSGSPKRGPKDKANPRFHALQEKLKSMPVPEFGSQTANEDRKSVV